MLASSVYFLVHVFWSVYSFMRTRNESNTWHHGGGEDPTEAGHRARVSSNPEHEICVSIIWFQRRPWPLQQAADSIPKHARTENPSTQQEPAARRGSHYTRAKREGLRHFDRRGRGCVGWRQTFYESVEDRCAGEEICDPRPSQGANTANAEDSEYSQSTDAKDTEKRWSKRSLVHAANGVV